MPEKASFFNKISPIDETKLYEYEFDTIELISEKLSYSRLAFNIWRKNNLEARGRFLFKVGLAIEEHLKEIATTVRLETGKPLLVAEAEVHAAADMFNMISAFGRLPMGQMLPSSNELRKTYTTQSPLGVAALLVSFNTPFPNFAWKVAPALMAGNSALLKPSEHTPLSAQLFLAILEKCGMQKNLVQIVYGDSKIGESLIASDVDLVSFTGSTSAGTKVGTLSASRNIKTILELGGNNPFIVLSDANLPEAASALVNSGFSNTGQRCASASRAIVESGVFDKFVEIVEGLTQKMSLGASEDSDIGPLINSNAAIKFENYIEACKLSGATVKRFGPKNLGKSFTQLALVIGLDPDSELSKQEVFGPLIRFYKASTRKDLLQIANNSEHGLTGAVWTENYSIAQQFIQELNLGTININGPTHGAEINMPFGGFKQSGNGTREAGWSALAFYSELKTISLFARGQEL